MKSCPLCKADCSAFERELNNIDLLRCESCGFVYANLPDEQILAVNSRFDHRIEATYYDEQQTFLDDIWFSRIVKRFHNRLGAGRVLDVGCGNGLLLRQFGAMGWECCGVDTSPWSADYAKRYGFRLAQGTIESFGEQLGQFDLVVSSSTLEHVAQPVPHVAAISRRVKPGGYAYFCGMPNYSSLSIHLGLSTFECNKPPAHVNYFTPETIIKLSASCGIPPDRISVRTYGIPELFRVYRGIMKSVRRKRTASGKDSGAGLSQGKSSATTRHPVGQVKRWAGTAAVNGLYYCGRIGSAGDKLEVVIRC